MIRSVEIAKPGTCMRGWSRLQHSLFLAGPVDGWVYDAERCATNCREADIGLLQRWVDAACLTAAAACLGVLRSELDKALHRPGYDRSSVLESWRRYAKMHPEIEWLRR